MAKPGPRDFSQRAVAVVDHLIEAYDEPEDAAPDPDPEPEPAQAKAGRAGGRARATALSAEQRSASARRAAMARWHPETA